MLWDEVCFLSHLLCSDESVTRQNVISESDKIFFFSVYKGSFWWLKWIFEMHMEQRLMSIVFWIIFTSNVRKLRKQLCIAHLIILLKTRISLRKIVQTIQNLNLLGCEISTLPLSYWGVVTNGKNLFTDKCGKRGSSKRAGIWITIKKPHMG